MGKMQANIVGVEAYLVPGTAECAAGSIWVNLGSGRSQRRNQIVFLYRVRQQTNTVTDLCHI